ncbi:hypothetical protein FR483_n543R [Paramecium bursaria Chlorella virus FR483]|uniref:Uncharacterized protein n543R n=1 Tax=Paramecium bursaria Chlorella virus FR483 TaxID=399781 RepID=A7J7P7_PBCVF|nr:hypothetical protein FR483_n543R [Paramecium bursaria Chlorella virus FR483]ABT15828.1 hypothetical protein FR483_n543R [Paramecium bursaria Chlorella virus FR483]
MWPIVKSTSVPWNASPLTLISRCPFCATTALSTHVVHPPLFKGNLRTSLESLPSPRVNVIILAVKSPLLPLGLSMSK